MLKFLEIQKIGHRNYFMSTCDVFFVFKVNLDSRNCSSVANGLSRFLWAMNSETVNNIKQKCACSEFGGGYGE